MPIHFLKHDTYHISQKPFHISPLHPGLHENSLPQHFSFISPFISHILYLSWGFPGDLVVKNRLPIEEKQVWSLIREDTLQKCQASVCSSVFVLSQQRFGVTDIKAPSACYSSQVLDRPCYSSQVSNGPCYSAY